MGNSRLILDRLSSYLLPLCLSQWSIYLLGQTGRYLIAILSAKISLWSTYLCLWQNHLFLFAKKVTVIPLWWPGYPLKFYLQFQPLVTDTKELYLYHSHLRFLICDFTMSTLPERIVAKVICPCCCITEACNCKVFRASFLQVAWCLTITYFNIKILW